MALLAHGWRLAASDRTSERLIRDFIRPAVRAIPPEMARQIGVCCMYLYPEVDGGNVASRWTAMDRGIDILIATRNREDHDIALELLVCLGQALWEQLSPDQSTAFWRLLDSEFQAGVEGEIDEAALIEKRALVGGRFSARSRRRLARYGRAAFAGTAAEYVHSLWHDVTVRAGPEHLPALNLGRRFRLLAHWFPPARGHGLFPRGSRPLRRGRGL